MSGTITRHPAWCSDCVTAKAPCSHHRSPDGHPCEYTGSDVYEPSEWVLEVVGKTYKGLEGTYVCFGYDPRHGFWMRNTETHEERNISERAIGRTYHRVRDERSTEPSRKEHMQWCKQRALAYLDSGDWTSAMGSMASDLTKHPETITLIEIMALGVATVRGVDDARRFIEGFGD